MNSEPSATASLAAIHFKYTGAARERSADDRGMITVENGESSPGATFGSKVTWKRVILSARNDIPGHMDRP